MAASASYLRTVLLVMLGVSTVMINCEKDDTPVGSSGTAGTGSLYVSTTPPGATITLDYVVTGQTSPDTLKAVSAGQHMVKLGLTGYKDSSLAVLVVQGQTTQLYVALQPVSGGSDSIYVRIQLDRLPANLPFDQSYVQVHYIEYWWGILFNTDSNDATGIGGFDVEVAMMHIKESANPFQGSVVQDTWHQVIEWIDTAGSLRGKVRHFDLPARIDAADTNTLIVAVPRSWSEIARLTLRTQYYVRTTYRPDSTTAVNDWTYTERGPGTVSDPTGDVSYAFVDIVSGGWNSRLGPASILGGVSQTAGSGGVVRRVSRSPRWSGTEWIHEVRDR